MWMLHEITSAWDENSVTWIEASSGVPWQRAGGDYSPEIIDTLHLDEITRQYTIDITQAVTHWVDEPAENHGLMLRSTTPWGVEYQFTTSEHFSLYARPRLEILYRWFPMPAPTFVATPLTICLPTPTPSIEEH